MEGRVFQIFEPFPLLGHLYFGLIDRGFNIVQARVSSLCNLSCSFCSVDAGLASRRVSEFTVMDPRWLGKWADSLINYKGEPTDVLFDAAGDPITNPLLPDFIKSVRGIGKVRWIILESRLHGASQDLIDMLADAGLDRLNISIDTLSREKASILTGNPFYDVEKVKRLVEYAFHERGIDVHIAPVWLPGINDEDLEEVIEWALRNGFGRRVPPLGIQKYVVHPHGRKVKGLGEPSWEKWGEFLHKLENKYGVKLILDIRDYNIKRAKQFVPPFRVGDEVWSIVVGRGPYPKEFLAVTRDYSYALTLIARRETYEEGEPVLVRIIRNKDGILLGIPS